MAEENTGENVKLSDAAAALSSSAAAAAGGGGEYEKNDSPAGDAGEKTTTATPTEATATPEEPNKAAAATAAAAGTSAAAAADTPAPAAAAAGEEAPQQFDFGERRRRKKKDKKEAEEEEEKQTIIDGSGAVFHRGKEYTYQEMLQRIQTLIEMHNPDLSGAKRYTIKPPQVVRVGSKKVAWINFREICTIMNRQPDHVHQFVLAELGTEGSIAGDGQLVLKGKYGPKHIEALLRKYITEYVTCQMCKSPNTVMQRDSRTRLWQQSCAACGANRSVTTIKSGFHAVGKGERRKAKLG